jgi:hypothetical protein
MSRFRGSVRSVRRRLSSHSVSTPGRDGLLRRRRGVASRFPSCAGRPGTQAACSCPETLAMRSPLEPRTTQGQSGSASLQRTFSSPPPGRGVRPCWAQAGTRRRSDEAFEGAPKPTVNRDDDSFNLVGRWLAWGDVTDGGGARLTPNPAACQGAQRDVRSSGLSTVGPGCLIDRGSVQVRRAQCRFGSARPSRVCSWSRLRGRGCSKSPCVA